MLILLDEFDFSIHHYFRESNKVTDFLAQRGALVVNKLFQDDGQFSRELKGIYKVDKLGKASIQYS